IAIAQTYCAIDTSSARGRGARLTPHAYTVSSGGRGHAWTPDCPPLCRMPLSVQDERRLGDDIGRKRCRHRAILLERQLYGTLRVLRIDPRSVDMELELETLHATWVLGSARRGDVYDEPLSRRSSLREHIENVHAGA